MSLVLIISLSVFGCACIIYVLWYVKNRSEDDELKHGITRHAANPVISPEPFREWEHGGTFNPAAIQDDEGYVHILYRAIGADGLSRIGHSKSKDGKTFDTRTPFPVYTPLPGFDIPERGHVHGPLTYAPMLYPSGGSWGGSEDPRAVVIDGRVYMTYVAFEGWQSVRIALTSISMDDLKHNRWNWKRPRYISPPKTVNKNWVIFPEKVNGKFAVLHSISPEIRIDYLTSLDGVHDPYIKSVPPSGGRPDHWDNWVRGAGPPPLKTRIGWLLLYHAMDRNDPNKYKLGAMILDLDDPTKVLYRSPQPILVPEMNYENDGKPGVVYASGALILGDELVIYYGGGDRHVCVAHTNLDSLLNWLAEYGS